MTMNNDEIAALQCLVTRNPCGTDTWAIGRPCKCVNCRHWLTTVDLEAEVERLKKALEPCACDCTGRCQLMEWLPADNVECASRNARAALAAMDKKDAQG